MERREDIEAWADALLDQYRDGPAGASKPQPASREALESLSPPLRWMLTRGGNVPDADRVERIRRAGERHRRFANAEAIVTMMGVVLAFAFVLVALSGF